MSPIDRPSRNVSLSEQGMREQIEVLWRYHWTHASLDAHFIRTHALMLVQLADEMGYPNAGRGTES